MGVWPQRADRYFFGAKGIWPFSLMTEGFVHVMFMSITVYVHVGLWAYMCVFPYNRDTRHVFKAVLWSGLSWEQWVILSCCCYWFVQSQCSWSWTVLSVVCAQLPLKSVGIAGIHAADEIIDFWPMVDYADGGWGGLFCLCSKDG